MNKKNITLIVNGVDLHFKPLEVDDFNHFLDTWTNPTSGQGATANCHNFLMRYITPESKENLKEIIRTVVGAALSIHGKLLEEYQTPLEISIKK